MTKTELHEAITAYFSENPLAEVQDIHDLVDQAYTATLAEQVPAYKPTTVEKNVSVDTSFTESNKHADFSRVGDESTLTTAEDLTDIDFGVTGELE